MPIFKGVVVTHLIWKSVNSRHFKHVKVPVRYRHRLQINSDHFSIILRHSLVFIRTLKLLSLIFLSSAAGRWKTRFSWTVDGLLEVSISSSVTIVKTQMIKANLTGSFAPLSAINERCFENKGHIFQQQARSFIRFNARMQTFARVQLSQVLHIDMHGEQTGGFNWVKAAIPSILTSTRKTNQASMKRWYNKGRKRFQSEKQKDALSTGEWRLYSVCLCHWLILPSPLMCKCCFLNSGNIIHLGLEWEQKLVSIIKFQRNDQDVNKESTACLQSKHTHLFIVLGIGLEKSYLMVVLNFF